MWQAVTDAVGVAARDSLWDYPDLMPTAEDIDDPAALIARLEARARGEAPAPDAFDDALAELLEAESGAGSTEASGEADAAPDADEPDDDEHPDGRPI